MTVTTGNQEVRGHNRAERHTAHVSLAENVAESLPTQAGNQVQVIEVLGTAPSALTLKFRDAADTSKVVAFNLSKNQGFIGRVDPPLICAEEVEMLSTKAWAEFSVVYQFVPIPVA